MQTSDVHTTDGPVNLSALRRTATERSPRLLSRRSNRKCRRHRSSSGLYGEMISPEEYEALPPSIQRKYFSPKERMHIAQQAATQMRRRQSMKGSWLAPPTPTSPARPSTSAGTLSRSTSSLANNSRVSLIQADQTVITEGQARWFLMLPDKVRKQYFSKEEQVALMVRCKKVLEHASPDMVADVYRRVLSVSREDRTSSSTKPLPSTSSEQGDNGKSYLTFGISSNASLDNFDCRMDVSRTYSGPEPQPPPVSCTAHEMMGMTSVPPLLSEPNEQNVLVDKSKRKSFMRRHSLTPLPLPAPTLAPPVPPVPRLPSMDQVRHFALSAKQARPSTEQAPDLPEPPRKYYRDQDARSKIRNALASDEKFDQALTIGFSPSEDQNDSTSTDSSLPLQQPALYHSEQEDDDEDAQSMGSRSPRTPTPTYTSDHQPAIKQPSFDSGVELPYTQVPRPKTSGSTAASTHNREMTIHMTLTRRDLRSPSPEEQLYSVQRFQNTGVDVDRVDPLALEPLPVSDDPSGAHGAFAVNDGVLPKGLKRVWKSLVRH